MRILLSGESGGSVNAISYIYVLADTTAKGEYSCPIEREWSACCYEYRCRIDLSVDDEFEDVLDTWDWIEEPDLEIPGGGAFEMSTSWTDYIVGSGAMTGE